MSIMRMDALEVIYEDDDEGAVSSNGSDEEDYDDDDPHTSLHGHPDHFHSGESDGSNRLSEGKILQSLRVENKELRSHLTVLAREIERADTELARWRAKYRKIEDERDTLKRELDKLFSANSQASIAEGPPRPSQCTVVYSTPSEVSNLEHPDSDFKQTRQQGSNDTEHSVSTTVNDNSSQASQQGIPVHRGRLRQQIGDSGDSDNTYRFSNPTEPPDPPQQIGGDFSNARPSARPPNPEAPPFSPSWIGPKVPVKDPPEPPSKDGSFRSKQNNADRESESSVGTNGISLPLSFQKPKGTSSLMIHEGHFAPSTGMVTTSPGSTIVSLSRQASPSTTNAIQPIQPPRRKSTDSLGRSASTTSTLSNSSSHVSSLSSGPSPTFSSPKKQPNSLAKQPSLELISSVISPDTFHSMAFAQTLRGRAKDILEGRVSPGFLHGSERSSAARLPDVAAPMHSILLNGNVVRGEIDGAEDSEPTSMSLGSTKESTDLPLIENHNSYLPTKDGCVELGFEDKRTVPIEVSLYDRSRPSQQGNVDGLLEGRSTRNGAPRALSSPGKLLNSKKGDATGNLRPQSKKPFPLTSTTNSSMAMNVGFRERADANRSNNLIDTIVQNSSNYPYTNINPLLIPTNLETGSIPQLQFPHTLTPGSNLPNFNDFSGVPTNGVPLFNLIPIHNGNVTALRNGPVSHSQVSNPSANTPPVNMRSFSPDRFVASPPRSVPSIPGFLPTPMRSPPFTQVPMVQDDPDYGPVIVHGPLPPRHAYHQHGQNVHPIPRRKREPINVPPRYLGLSTGIPAHGISDKRAGTGTDLDGSTTNDFGNGAINHGW